MLSLHQVACKRGLQIMSIWKLCHLKCQLKNHFPTFYALKLCRRYLHNRSRKKTILSLYEVDVQTKHAQNEKRFFNSIKRNIKRRTRAIYYWYNTRSFL